MSFIIICFNVFDVVICCHLCHNCFEAVTELYRASFSISVYVSIGKFIIPVTSNQIIPNNQTIAGSADRGGLDINTVLNLRLQVNYINPLLYTVSVSDCTSPGLGILYILIGELTSKSAML